MIGSIFRSVLAVIAGLVAATVFVIGTEIVSAKVYPPTPGVDLHDIEACKAYVRSLPADAYVIGGAGWALAVLSGSWVATRLGAGRHPAHGIVVGSILLALAITNMLMLPYPIGFWVGNLVSFPAATYLGVRWGRAQSNAVASMPAANERG